MPPLSRWYIKTSLLYLAISLLTGVFLSSGIGDSLVALRFSVTHLFVVGWLTQLIFGVAFWLFPRHSREQPYGDTRAALASYPLLNLGLLLRLLAEPALAASTLPVWSWLLVLAAVFQWLGAVAYAAYIWRRVKVK